MRDRRKVHLLTRINQTWCGRRLGRKHGAAVARAPEHGHLVTCLRCRASSRWLQAREASAWGVRERIRVALTRSGPLHGPTSRYLEALADPATYGEPDLVALLDVLAPVHPGWDDVERAGEAWEPPTL